MVYAMSALVKSAFIQHRSNTTVSSQRLIRPSDTLHLSAGSGILEATGGAIAAAPAAGSALAFCVKEELPAVCVGVRTYAGAHM
jgi:hypothetical protein